ncbi:glycoside hydrolase family 2 TIM barrel-domain containing protein [Flavobacteriaceae bacterium MHTCC 0001]
MKFFFNIILLASISFYLSSYNAFAQEKKYRLIDGWEFKKGNVGSVYEIWRHEKHSYQPWDKVSLPHTVNALDAVDPDVKYYQGEMWYRKNLKIDNPYPKGRTLLHFEGAGMKTNVYTYLKEVGNHVGGYDEFTMDMTESFQEFSSNPLFQKKFKGLFPVAVKCDNSKDMQMMPSDLNGFTHYGGLKRYVNLVYVPAVSIKQLHIEPQVVNNGKSANVKLRLSLYNPEEIKEDVEFNVVITSPSGKEVYKKSFEVGVFKNQKEVLEFQLKKPKLWSPDTPSLYNCEFSLSTSHGEHKINEKFGVRYFEFIKKGPFKLNGKRLLLRGTHRHEDHAGVGAAMTEDMMKREMKMIKDMGVNFIRLAHFQQSPIVLDLCDELGILVWEEIPWSRGGLGGKLFQDRGRQMLTNMIHQHYNHPSVIIWGLGNENEWKGDYEVFSKDAIRKYMSSLNDLSHELDPLRKTAIRKCWFCKDIVDVYSPSIWAGWYHGRLTDYKNASENQMKEVDHFLHVEWGASSHAGRHSENPYLGIEDIAPSADANERDGDHLMHGGKKRASKDGDWSETYTCDLIDWHLKEQEHMEWLSGTAYWPFKDFTDPTRPHNPIFNVNQKGVVERDFTKKEGYYVFQSYWTEQPMIRVYGHSWETRWGKKEEKKMIKVYSNCPEAELIVNGKKFAKKKRDSQDYPAAGLRWEVELKEGENAITAVGYKNSKVVKDEIKFNYQTQTWSAPVKFKLSEVASKDDVVKIKVEALDKNGVKCLDARNKVRFEIVGDGQLLENLGTSGGSKEVQLYNGHAFISVKKNNGVSYVCVSEEKIPTEFIRLN